LRQRKLGLWKTGCSCDFRYAGGSARRPGDSQRDAGGTGIWLVLKGLFRDAAGKLSAEARLDQRLKPQFKNNVIAALKRCATQNAACQEA